MIKEPNGRATGIFAAKSIMDASPRAVRTIATRVPVNHYLTQVSGMVSI
jgi:hypothetical protein